METIVYSDDAGEWLRDYDLIVDRLNQAGCAVHPSSRLGRFPKLAKAVLERRISSLGPDSQREDVLHAARDIAELKLIVQTLLPSDNAALRQKLLIATRGAASPDDDAKTLSRDTQFELYVGALLALHGREPVFEEPDIRFKLGSEVVGVAAKRLQSAAAFKRRLSDGGKQLRRWGLNGIVAISLDRLLPATPIIMPTTQDFVSWIFEKPIQLLEPFKSDALEAVSGRPVIAILASVTVIGAIGPENRLGHAASILLRVVEGNAKADQREALVVLAQDFARAGRM